MIYLYPQKNRGWRFKSVDYFLSSTLFRGWQYSLFQALFFLYLFEKIKINLTSRQTWQKRHPQVKMQNCGDWMSIRGLKSKIVEAVLLINNCLHKNMPQIHGFGLKLSILFGENRLF